MATPTQKVSPQTVADRVFLLYCPECEFLVPYLERQLGPRWHVVTHLADCDSPDRVLMISSTDIYDVEPGLNYDESSPVDAESAWHQREMMFEGYCRQRSLRPVVIRCANIVGTGMTGLPMTLARGIFRGTLRHIADRRAKHSTRINRNPDNTPRTRHLISVVHATDVALASDLLTRSEAASLSDTVFNLTDNSSTTVDELIDALARRINNKHVPSASPFWARILSGRDAYRAMTSSLTFNCARIIGATGIEPVRVTDYLTTHIYDENSL